MAYDAGLAERVADVLERLGERGVRQKNVFGGRGFLIGKSMFLNVGRERLLVKTPTDEYQDALTQPGIEPFAPGGERPMGTWVMVPAEAVADDPELTDWVSRGLRGIRR